MTDVGCDAASDGCDGDGEGDGCDEGDGDGCDGEGDGESDGDGCDEGYGDGCNGEGDGCDGEGDGCDGDCDHCDGGVFTCCGLLARQISSNLISSCELQTLPEKKRKVIKKDREGEEGAFSLHEK